MCKNIETEQDAKDFLATVADDLAGLTQTNYPRPVGTVDAWPIKSICNEAKNVVVPNEMF